MTETQKQKELDNIRQLAESGTDENYNLAWVLAANFLSEKELIIELLMIGMFHQLPNEHMMMFAETIKLNCGGAKVMLGKWTQSKGGQTVIYGWTLEVMVGDVMEMQEYRIPVPDSLQESEEALKNVLDGYVGMTYAGDDEVELCHLWYHYESLVCLGTILWGVADHLYGMISGVKL